MPEFRARSASQEDYVRVISENDITICIGPCGTGKTAIPCALACQKLIDNEVQRIIVTRPIIESGKGLGFLPGTFGEKTSVYMIPVMEELSKYLGKTHYDECIKDGTIEVVPPEYMRGRNFHDSYILCDEAQNLTYKQLVMLITRFGRKSKMVINGDPDQCDLLDYEAGALLLAHKALQGVHGVGTHTFGVADIVRSKVIGPILKRLNDAHILDQEARNGRVGSN